MRCVRCGKPAEYIYDGKSVCETCLGDEYHRAIRRGLVGFAAFAAIGILAFGPVGFVLGFLGFVIGYAIDTR